MKEFWNQRYQESEYAYGTKPNEFFKENIDKLTPGKILLPAEGEGRNAVYAARKGWNVEAFDYSEAGKDKTLKLATEFEVSVTYEVIDVADFSVDGKEYDVIGLFYTHFPAGLREPFFKKVVQVLKTSGYVIFEAFHKNQLNYTSGGPKDVSMLYSVQELESEFEGLKILSIEDKVIELDEGSYHKGEGHVVRMIATKIK